MIPFQMNFLFRKKYQKNESLTLAWDRIKVSQINLFITTIRLSLAYLQSLLTWKVNKLNKSILFDVLLYGFIQNTEYAPTGVRFLYETGLCIVPIRSRAHLHGIEHSEQDIRLYGVRYLEQGQWIVYRYSAYRY